MLTIFDRYLLGRLFYVYFVLFVCTFGLFVVIDGFSNVDGFQAGNGDLGTIVLRMAAYYALQSSIFFELVGSILAVVAVMVVFALLLKQGEVHPVLAAGVSLYRLLKPIVLGVIVITGGLIANRELVIPRIAHLVHGPRSSSKAEVRAVTPVFDHSNQIQVSGRNLIPARGLVADAQFVLLAPHVAEQLTTLEASVAKYLPANSNHPAGWLLKDVSPEREHIKLTEKGRKIVVPTTTRNEEGVEEHGVFVVTNVSFNELSNRSRSSAYASTWEVYQEIRNPTFGYPSVRKQILNLHSRIVQPFLNLSAAILAVPLIVRKESYRLIVNMAVAAAVLGLLYVLMQVGLHLARLNFIEPALAAWLPVIVCGTLCVWLFGRAQT